ncbi:MAG: hypothetical protein LBE82_05725 [Chitinophagaceae bacterium]|jgi:N-acetylneuraminic acid mutarotase|nr:hypothetical protein [Chitinophagaceae bacterium]
MHKFKYFFLVGAVVFSLAACSPTNPDAYNVTNTTLGNWVYVSAFDGTTAKFYASSFVIGDYAYVVGGASIGTLPIAAATKDMFRFDPSANGGMGTWAQMAPLSVGRNSAVAFAIGEKGYVGTGNTVIAISQPGSQLNDMWEYDPASNTWRQMASVPGGPRFAAVGFSIGNLGYIGTGMITDTINPGTFRPIKEFYSFDPTQGDSGKWVQESSMINDKRAAAQSFVYNNQAYVVGGLNDAGKTSVDFEVFTPGSTQGSGSWKMLTPITPISDSSKTSLYTSDLARCSGVMFVMGNQAYLCTGATGYPGSTINTTWMYSFPPADLWVQRTPFETNNGNSTSRSPRFGAVGFVVQGRAFLGMGTSSVSTQAVSDFNEWQPTIQYNAND